MSLSSTYVKRVGCTNGKPQLSLPFDFLKRAKMVPIAVDTLSTASQILRNGKSLGKLRFLEGEDVIVVFPEKFQHTVAVETIDEKILSLLCSLRGKYGVLSSGNLNDEANRKGCTILTLEEAKAIQKVTFDKLTGGIDGLFSEGMYSSINRKMSKIINVNVR